ncbi:alpha/beta hydrolase [Kitasatospora aureofaciens]|uniref:alpha/beta fold hydrolase n=1 Tax=Kitasatospora aureofaciens TaxID=1894 RepID=UPI001C45EA77|nr:alpha/beta hydrolase [Kitasatospora aureofaciens]MBV6696729.1 alpha/beta hydrolase [Kitasatospora aureofaciens]
MSFAHVNGIELHYEDHGQEGHGRQEAHGTGRPLVFLHGWGTSGRAWDAQLADLARDHRTVTVDWRGCGRSDHPVTGNDVAGNVADVLALVDLLALDRPVLVGSSIGASFALEAALAAPERVGGVVSVDGPGHWPSQGMAPELNALMAGLAADRAGTVADWVPNWYGPATSRALIDRTVRQLLDSGVFIDALFTEALSYDPRPALPRLAVPAVFVHGRLDTEIPVEVSEALAALAPHGEIQVIEDAAHMPHQERPAAFNAALRAALARMALVTA